MQRHGTPRTPSGMHNHTSRDVAYTAIAPGELSILTNVGRVPGAAARCCAPLRSAECSATAHPAPPLACIITHREMLRAPLRSAPCHAVGLSGVGSARPPAPRRAAFGFNGHSPLSPSPISEAVSSIMPLEGQRVRRQRRRVGCFLPFRQYVTECRWSVVAVSLVCRW